MVDKQTIEELEIIIKANVTQAMQGIQDVVKAVEKDANKIKAPIQQISTDVDRSIAKSTKGIERALDTISGKSSKLGNLKAQIQENIKAIEMFQEALKDLKAGALSENTQGFLYALAERNIANRTGRNPEEVSYKEVDKEIKDILSNEEKRAEIINQINSLLKDQTGELNKQEKEFKQVRNTENWHKGLEKIWRSFRRGLLTIIGVRSAWALLRKGMSEALQTSEKLQAQVRVTSNAFGQLFLPIMEKVVAITRKAVIFIGLVIEALTGMNLLAKTTTKSIQDQNKALEGTLSTIDEIENLQNPNQTYLNDIEALGQFQEEIAKMRKALKDSGIYEWLQKVGKAMKEEIIPRLKTLWNDTLKPFIDEWLIPTMQHLWGDILYPMLKWLLDHPSVFATIFAIFTAGKLVADITSVTTKLSALSGIIQGFSTIGAIVITLAVAYKIGEDIVELGDNWDSVRNSMNKYWDNWYEQFMGASKQEREMSKGELENGLFSLTTNTDANNNTWLNMISPSKNMQQTRDIFEKFKKYKSAIQELKKDGSLTAEEIQKYREYTDEYYNSLMRLADAYPNGKNKKEIETMMKEVDDWYGSLYKWEKELKTATSETTNELYNRNVKLQGTSKIIQDGMKSAKDSIKETADEVGSEKKGSLMYNLKQLASVFNEGFKIKLKGNTTELKNQLNEILKEVFKPFGSLGSSIFTQLTSKAVFQANGYVAYEPTLAIQGEYAGARTNPEITAPQDMIEASMLNAFSKIIPYMNQGTQHGDIVLNINGKEFARATYEDTQNEIARRNSATTIKVVR